MAKPLTSWLVPSFSQHNLRLVVSERYLHFSVTKFQDKSASLRQVNSPYSWNKFQICCTDMYLIGFLLNFGVFLSLFVNFSDLPEFHGSVTTRNIRSPVLEFELPFIIQQPTFCNATTGFPSTWRLRIEHRNSVLHVSTQIWVVLWLVDNLLHPIIKSTAQIWVMLCHQYGIPALVSETFLWGNQCWCHKMFRSA